MKNGIKKLCAQNEISISELGRRIGMQPHTLRRYTRIREDGSQEAQPSIELATKIAKALDVSVDQVIGVNLGSAADKRNVTTMPLYGAVQGGSVGFDITDVTEPIDAIDTPSWLSSVPDCYAVFVTRTAHTAKVIAWWCSSPPMAAPTRSLSSLSRSPTQMWFCGSTILTEF